jgi:PAS domain-containing protein
VDESELRSEIESLRARNRELLQRAVDAEQALAAIASDEVDAITVATIETPLLLHAAQDDLRRSKGLLRAVFDGALDAMLLADDAGAYIDVNLAGCELFAVSGRFSGSVRLTCGSARA